MHAHDQAAIGHFSLARISRGQCCRVQAEVKATRAGGSATMASQDLCGRPFAGRGRAAGHRRGAGLRQGQSPHRRPPFGRCSSRGGGILMRACSTLAGLLLQGPAWAPAAARGRVGRCRCRSKHRQFCRSGEGCRACNSQGTVALAWAVLTCEKSIGTD